MTEYHRSEQNKPLSFATNQIPEELKRLPQWMGTRLRRSKNNPEKLEKPPHSVVGGLVSDFACDKTDPANWATFEDAAYALEAGLVDAIGIVLMDSDPFYGIDGDNCISRETGEIAPRVADFIHDLGSYAEISISGTGVRLIGIGEKPSWARTVSTELGWKLEVYDRAAFLVMTGNRITEHTEPQYRQRELNALCRELWPKPKVKPGPTRTVPIDLDDEQLLEKARNSRKGARFRRLYDQGDPSGFESVSEADMSLTNTLIFWTGADPDRVIRLFEASALYRTKDDGKNPGYVGHNVRKALATYNGPLYEPKKVSVGTQKSPRDPLVPYLELLVRPALWSGPKAASAYKGFSGLLRAAVEHGVVNADGKFMIGIDMRRLAEKSGMGVQTLCQSALPELYKLGLVRWQKPTKKSESGTFVLLTKLETIKTSTPPSIVSSLVNPSEALERLSLITRMRSGRSSYGSVDRLGPACMFVAIALAFSGGGRGCSAEELEQITGRRKARLVGTYLPRLKEAGVVIERGGLYRLHEDFEEFYQRNLDLSGVTRSEKWQRRQHAKEKAEYAKELAKRQRERNQDPSEEPEEEEYTPASAFLSGELKGVSGMDYDAMLERWSHLGGTEEDLKRAIWQGPYRFKREGFMRIIYRDRGPSSPRKTKPKPKEAASNSKRRLTDGEVEKVKRLIAEGMSPKWARAEVMGELRKE